MANAIKQLLERAPITDFVPVADAIEAYGDWRIDHGWKGRRAPQTTPPTANHKLALTTAFDGTPEAVIVGGRLNTFSDAPWERIAPVLFERFEHLIPPPDVVSRSIVYPYGWSLAPARESGHNWCPFSTPQCRAGCVAHAGKGELPMVKKARIDKANFARLYTAEAVTLVAHELEKAMRKKEAEFGLPVYLMFYDYGKDWSRLLLPANYYLTYSASEKTSDADVLERVAAGYNVAVVFKVGRTKPLPDTYLGVPVIDADKSDYRPADPRGQIVGLRAKGRMRKAEYVGGFVKEVR